MNVGQPCSVGSRVAFIIINLVSTMKVNLLSNNRFRLSDFLSFRV